MLYGKKWLAVLAIVVLAFLPACGGGGGGGNGGNPSTNSDPIADAGTDQNVKTGATVTLDGSGSYDPDGDILTFTWSLVAPAGSSATLSDNKAVRPTFVADVDGKYVVQLTVDDGTMAVLSNPVTVTATPANVNSAPVANAGPDQSVKTGSVVTLNGNRSSDADNDPLTYSWSFVSFPGSIPTLSDSTAVMPTFTPDVDGNYVVRLIVNDGTVSSAPDTVTVTATPATVNSAPVAKAGPDQSVAMGSGVVTLNGSASSDPDSDPLTYSWSFVRVPAGSSATLSDRTAIQPTFTPDRAGEYLISLTDSDGKLQDSDTILVESSYDSLFTMVPSGTVFRSADGIFYLAGSQFGASITNNSLLDFGITKAELFSGSIVLGSIDNPSVPGEDIFSPNESASAGFTLDRNVQDEGFEFRYYLIRPDTSETFVVKYLYDN